MVWQESETVGMNTKVEKMSAQRGVKMRDRQGKESAMTETKNLAIENECFGETPCEFLAQ